MDYVLRATLEKLRFSDEESDGVIYLCPSEIDGVVRTIRPVVRLLLDGQAKEIADAIKGSCPDPFGDYGQGYMQAQSDAEAIARNWMNHENDL